METKKRGPGRPRDAELAARRREEILAEATGVFAAAGYRQADVQVVADRLGVGKGTVYRYFESKEALFFGAVDAGIRALVERVDAATARVDDPVEHLKKAVHAYLGFFDENPDLVELLIIERAEFRDREQATYFVYKDRNYDRRVSFIRQGIERGVIRDVPPDRVMNVVGDCLYGTIFTNHFSKRKIPFQRQAEDVIDLLMNGVFTAGSAK